MDESRTQELIDQAMAALRDGDYVRALAVGDQLAAAAPDLAVARAIRAQALLGADSPEESLGEARRAVQLAPGDGHAHRLLALAAWRNGRLMLAQESFERAIKLSGRRPAMLSEYAWFMATERGPKLAERAARDAVEADADDSTAWAALGQAQFKLRRRAEAEASLRRALELDPNDIYAQSAMVALLHERRDDADAETLVDSLEEIAGTEELVASVRDDAKQRQIARMLLERNVDLDGLDHEPRRYGWVWLLGSAAVVALLSYFFDPRGPIVVLAFALLLLLAMRKWFD